MKLPVLVLVIVSALLVGGAGGYAISERSATPKAAAAKSVAVKDSQAVADMSLPDCTKLTEGKACKVENARSEASEQSNFDPARPLYVREFILSSHETWQDAVANAKFRMSSASGTPSFIIGNGESFWDLNRGAGGTYIAFAYTTTTNPNQALRDIAFSRSDRLGSPWVLRGDANDYVLGKGGFSKTPWHKLKANPIYVYSSQDPNSGLEPITAIGMRSCWNKARSCHIYEPNIASSTAPWQEYAQDLNANVGGNWIWLRVQRAAS